MSKKTQARKTQLKKAAFIQAYLQTATVYHAAIKSGVSRSRHHVWMRKDPTYRQAFEEAEEAAVDELEAEARRRALEGTEEPVGFYKGVAAEYVKRYSDTLLIFLLKGARPEKYAERREISGIKGRPIEVEVPAKAPFDWEGYHRLYGEQKAIEAARIVTGPSHNELQDSPTNGNSLKDMKTNENRR
jgi:hypothetical protein